MPHPKNHPKVDKKSKNSSTELSRKPVVLERLEPQRIPQPRRPWDRNKLIMVIGAGVCAAQLFLPAPLKPFHLAGEAAAQFHGALFDEVNRKELELAQQRAIAEKKADLQSQYATWKGMCSLTGTFDPRLGMQCHIAADNYFQDALRQIERSELEHRVH